MEPVLWQSKELPVNPKQVLLLTEFTSFSTSPPLPTSSLSSEGYRSASLDESLSPDHHPPITPDVASPPLSLPPFSFNHLLITSGPGFSMGIFPLANGSETYEHLSVPVLQDPTSQDTISQEMISQSMELATIFAMSEIQCITMPSDNQLWVGTNKGTLHSFELTHQLIPEEDTSNCKKSFKLSNHHWLAINEPLISIAARPNDCVFSIGSPSSSLTQELQPRSEVIVGVPYGYIVILQGEVDQSGRMKDPLEKMSRRIIRLTNSPNNCHVKCIAHVLDNKKVEMYWCTCGSDIIVLRSSDWHKMSSFSAQDVLNPTAAKGKYTSGSDVVQLLVCDEGVWSAVAHSSTLILWDKTNFSPKLALSYCDPHRSRQQRSHVSIIHYMSPYLFIGTKKGDIMVFQINNTSSSSQHSLSKHTTTLPQKIPTQKTSPQKTQNQLSYTFITNTNIGPCPILNIYTTPTETRPHIPLPNSPGDSINSIDSFISHTHTSLFILLITGGDPKSQLLLYELSLSSSSSNSLRSSPTLSVGSNSTMGSSIRGTTPRGSVTPLSVTPKSLQLVWSVGGDFTPLRNQDASKKRRGSSFL